jgi:hypothetical protein
MESLETVAKSMRELAEATLSEHHSTGALASAAGGSYALLSSYSACLDVYNRLLWMGRAPLRFKR